MDPAIVARHLQAGKYFQVAAFIMFVYDHMLTLGQEVERIWKRPLSYASTLYFINRYATLMQFIVIVTAFNDPDWRGETAFRCRRFVLFEGACTVAIIAGEQGPNLPRIIEAKNIYFTVGQMIMILRVVAIYERSKRVFAFLFFLWAFQIIISAVGLKTGYPVPLPSGLVGCILTGHGMLYPSVWISPLVTNLCIFLLTIYRTKHYIRPLFSPLVSEAASRTIVILVCDGTMYFFVIFLANLMNALVYFLAESDLKAIGASFSPLLTCTVVSRLVLNLRSLSDDVDGTIPAIEDSIVFNAHRCHRNSFGSYRAPRRQLQSTSIWSKALDDFTEDDTQFASESGHVTVVDVPLQQLGTNHGGDDRGTV
ncbi:hypothetical protein AGABI2DRAFT_117376 [Agaricus bisporus var. bisporus H97]|uniref:hypothetical protein n=1 Tax=Agaricus bisporus var. bisporus (strain H97 / ATCC MYA-4626 / FGSC 10389) TaxID=936046 RepID=UPI00029F602D|nr:hypothetical protein AGABI2DRAFT_117376 [Agaricus bisporus var. bisporus H97]EKV48565.1 hypothetical protein AGABI2DRAFT_117376 [Agaricus bisporus var. bisporus H97]